MIRFFRRLRQRLLSENKLSKYLLYAIGEIVLVVIGILIALQINNWNQRNKDQQAGLDLLERLQRDLVRDTLYLRATIQKNNRIRQDLKSSMITLYAGVNSMEQVYSLSSTYDQALDQVFAPNDNTYRSIVSAGTMSLIPGAGIREAILEHYGNYEKVSALLASINNWMGGLAIEVDVQTDFLKFNQLVSDIYTREVMLGERDFAFLRDTEDPGFKLLVRAFSATAFNQRVRNQYYENLITRCDDLLSRIDGVLNENT